MGDPMMPADPGGPFLDWSTFWTKDRSEPEWVVPDVLARRRGHAVWAKGGSGKSEFMQWVSLKAIEAGNVVVYLDYEMIEDDVFDRLEAFGCGPETDLSLLEYALIPDLRPLDTADGAADLSDLIDLAEFKHQGKHVVVIVDTLGRAVVGDENSNDTVMDFYRYTGQMMKRRGITWCRLDHTGHEGEHARGGSAKRDDVDVSWKHEQTDGGCRLIADKRRSSWIPERVTFDRVEAPVLRYDPAPVSYPAGTNECVDLLDSIDFSTTSSGRAAVAALREAGHGRRKGAVLAAQRIRGMRPGTTPGTTPPGPEGNHARNHPEEARSHGQEPPPEPLGTTLAGSLGTIGGSPMGTTWTLPTDSTFDGGLA